MSTPQTGPVFAGYTEDQLTAPMPCSQPPERPGVYLRQITPPSAWMWAEWDGARWHAGVFRMESSPAGATRRLASAFRTQGLWRGLNFNPEAAQRPEIQHHPV